MSRGDQIDEILENGENLEFRVSRDKDRYDIRASFDYKGNKVDMLVDSVETQEELGRFYQENLSDMVPRSSNTVYGTSERVKQKLAEKDTSALANSTEWAVNPKKALMKHMENGTYSEVIDHTSASALSAITLSESYGQKRTETYSFYINTIRDLEPEEKSPGMIDRAKQRAKDKAKDKTKNAAKKALEDAKEEFRRLEEEGKIDEAKEKAKNKAKEAAKKKISETKDSAKRKARNRVNDFGGKLKKLSPLYAEETYYEGPEPNAKIEMDNGITVYYYGDDYQDFLENRDEN